MKDAPILNQSVRWGEDYVSRALNFKFSGIIPAGIYRGFEVIPYGEMSLAIVNGDDYARSVAVVERDGYSLTITMEDSGLVQIPAPGTWFVCIEAFYAPTKQGYQRIVAREKAEAHHVILATAKADGQSPLEISYADRQKGTFAKEVFEFARNQQMKIAAQNIRISDRLTRRELANIERQAELACAIQNCLQSLTKENANRNLHEAETAKIAISALDRITKLELAFLDGLPSGDNFSPSGYRTLSGARVAPVTIIGGRTEAPANAALGLRLMEIEQGD